MTKREQKWAMAILLLGAVFLGDRLLFSPWMERWEQVGSEQQRIESLLEEAKPLLEREQEVNRKWKAMEEILTGLSEVTTEETLLLHMGAIEQRAGVRAKIESSPEVHRGEFREIILKMSLETTVTGLRNVLIELYNSEEFLRVSRLAVRTHADSTKGPLLDVDLHISTLEYRPVRPGGKKS